jgi:DNA-binding CsgD family transcriptional regulator
MPKQKLRESLVSIWPGMPYLALGLWLTWTQLAFGAAIWSSDVEINGIALYGMETQCKLAQSLLFLIAPLAWLKLGHLVNNRVVAVGALLASCGALLIVFCGPYYFFYDPYAVYIGPVSLVMMGIGSGAVALKSMDLYGRLTPRKALLYAAMAVLESILVYFLIVHAPRWEPVAGGPSIIDIIAFVGLPLLTALLATLPVKNKGRNLLSVRFSASALPRPFWKLLVVCAALSLIVGMLTAMVVIVSPPAIAVANNDLRMLLQLAIVLILAIFAIYVDANRVNLGRVYSVLAVALVVTIALIPLIGSGSTSWYALATAISDMFMLLLWLLLAFLCFQKQLEPMPVFGLAFGVFTLGSALGWLMGDSVQPLVPTDFESLPFYFILAGIILVLMLVLFSEKELDHLFLAASEQEPQLTELLEEGIKEVPVHRQGHFSEVIEQVSGQMRLSKRETEVLRYLAMGRNSDFIAEKMSVTTNTARVHTRNVYTKLNVHSRQELMDLVDSFGKG